MLPRSREVSRALAWTRTFPVSHTVAGTVFLNADLAKGHVWLRTISCLDTSQDEGQSGAHSAEGNLAILSKIKNSHIL